MMPQLATFKCYHIAVRVGVPDKPFRSLAFPAGGIQLVIIPVDYSGNERVLIDELANGLVKFRSPESAVVDRRATMLVRQAFDGAPIAEIPVDNEASVAEKLDRATRCFADRAGWLP